MIGGRVAVSSVMRTLFGRRCGFRMLRFVRELVGVMAFARAETNNGKRGARDREPAEGEWMHRGDSVHLLGIETSAKSGCASVFSANEIERRDYRPTMLRKWRGPRKTQHGMKSLR